MESALCTPADAGFRLIETGLWTPDHGLHRRALHLSRLSRSAARLGIVPKGVEAALDAARFEGPTRLRLTVDRQGTPEITGAPFSPLPEGTVWRVAVAPWRLTSADPWLQVKTTKRALYDQARARLPAGVDELLFLNELGTVCEGTITNLFVQDGDSLLTPPLTDGCLPGILRQTLIQDGATEQSLHPEQLETTPFFVGNALRGLIPARLTRIVWEESRPLP
jgi:4-amino-4-deoxychorismate lyase